jgi:hypothetical protein
MNCKACGSTDVKKRTYKEIIKAPFGSEELYHSTTVFCNVCKENIDMTEDEPVVQAIQRSEKNGLAFMVRELAKKGLKDGEIERAMRLPFGTIQRNIESTDSMNPTLYALLVVLMNSPRLLEHEQMFHCRVVHSQEVQ